MIGEALLCLALNVYFETAPKEPIEGSLAVAFVPRTRAQNNGTGVCWEIFRVGQFSWANDGTNLRELPKPTDEKWLNSMDVALAVLNGADDFTMGATHYHSTRIHPRWAKDKRMKKIGIFGSHVFYRWEP